VTCRSRREFLIYGGAAASTLVTAGAPRPALAGGRWETITKESGITVTNRREKNRQFPTFRGTGRVSANLWDVIAVIQDGDKHPQWLHKCADAGVLKQIDEVTRIVYNRVDAPWPVKDRDVVLRGKIDFIDPDSEVKIRFRSINSSLRKRPSDVVRMPQLEGHWYLVAMGDNKTLVEYQINADPGGDLPPWVVEQATKDLPLYTLKNLRGQVGKTKGQYKAFVADARARILASR
jgi:hypothetical protein